MSSLLCPSNLPNITSELKYSIRLAIPLIASEVLYGLNSFVATIMVSHLGKEQLAANALAWHIYVAVIIFFIGILCAIGIMVSQSFGAKDKIGISISFKQGLIAAIVLSLPMMLTMWLAPIVLVWTKQDPTVIAYAKPLFYSLIWSMLPLNIWVVIQQFLIGITKTRLVMLMSISAIPIEIFFYYAFLFGNFGLPQLGLAGIGYGLTASYLLGSLCFGCYLYFGPLKLYSLFKTWWIIDRKFFLEIFRVGLPMGFMYCSELAFFAAVAIVMGVLGTSVLAAYQIADQYFMIALTILFAMGQSVAMRVGNEVGRNDRERLRLTFVVHIIMSLVLISILSIVYMAFPQVIIGIDIDINSEHYRAVAAEAVKFLPIIGIILIEECVRFIANSALRGLKDSNFQMVISILGFWLIACPFAYLFGFKLGYGGVGIWWGIAIGILITGIALLLRFNRLAKHVDLSSLVTQQ